MLILIIWEKFKKLKTRCIIKHIKIAAISPKNKLKFIKKNSNEFHKKYESFNVFNSVISLVTILK